MPQNSERSTTPSHVGPVLRAAALAYVPLCVGAGLTAAAAALGSAPFQTHALLPPDPTSIAQDVLAWIATLASFFAFFAAPGILALRAFRVRAPNPTAKALAAFTLSNLLLALAWIAAMTLFPGRGTRICAYETVAALDAALLLLGVFTAGSPAEKCDPRECRDSRREVFIPAAAIGAMLVAGLLLFPGKLRIESLEGDATEVLGFGASLFESGVPKWDLESGAWGFYPTFVFVSYPVFFSLAIGGVTEASVRLPALLFLGVLTFAALDLARRAARPPLLSSTSPSSLAPLTRALPPTLAVAFLSLLVGAHYAGYHPYHGDLGCSPLEEWMVTGFALCAVVLARDGMPKLAAAAGLFSALTFPSGLMLVGFFGLAGLCFGSRDERRAVLRTGLWLGVYFAVFAAALAAYATANGTLGPMMSEWNAKYFEGRASFADESPWRMLEALGWFALLSGGAALVALPIALVRGDRVARWIAAASGAWLVFFLLSPAKNIHYFMPIAFAPVVVALRLAFDAGPNCRRARLAPPLLTISALVAILLAWPARVPPYVADREFGRASVFLAPTLREAVEDSKIIYNFAEPLWKWRPGQGWTIGIHTWVIYSARPNDSGWKMTAPPTPGTFTVGSEPLARADLQEITRLSTPRGPVIFAAPRGREDWRAWRDRSYPLRRDLSRFNFDMEPDSTPRSLP